jgi:hypothetical protein
MDSAAREVNEVDGHRIQHAVARQDVHGALAMKSAPPVSSPVRRR